MYNKFAIMSLVLIGATSNTVMAVGVGNDNPPSTSTVTTTNTVSNDVSNENVNANESKSTATSSSTSGDVTSNNVVTGPSVSTGATSTTANSGSHSSSVSVSTLTEAQQRNPVSSAVAPMLVTGSDTCMGSSSGGAQSVSIGVSLGTTWTDQDCVTRKDAVVLQAMGQNELALSLLCGKESMREAVRRTNDANLIALCGAELKEVKHDSSFLDNNDAPLSNSFGGE